MTRRGLIFGASAAVALLAGGVYRFTNLVVRHYAPTPYDDVLDQIGSREEAAKLGRVWLRDARTFHAKEAAQQLRKQLRSAGLAATVQTEIRAGKLRQIGGWVVPESVALLAGLAAKA